MKNINNVIAEMFVILNYIFKCQNIKMFKNCLFSRLNYLAENPGYKVLSVDFECARI